MHSTKRIVIDLLSGNRPETIHVVQGDAYSRVAEIDLRQGKKPWAIPDGVSVAVEYIKPDGTKGLYDTLPDGTQAWNTEGNILTLMLAPQMLTANGTVVTQVRVMLGNTQLSLVKFSVYVHQKITGAESEDYINWRSAFLPQVEGAKAGQYFEIEEVDKNGRIVKIKPVDAPQGAGGGTAQETDPTVPEWAKQPNKPSYTAEEVGALPADTVIPDKLIPDTIARKTDIPDSSQNDDIPENVALLEDVTVDEASGDFIPMLSANGTEYRLSIGDDGIPVIRNLSGATVWTGASGGGDSGGSDSEPDAFWTSGVPYNLTIVTGEYVDDKNGAFVPYAGWARTDYTPCAGAARIVSNGSTYSTPYCAWYDINKAFISKFVLAANQSSEIEVPANAAYFVVSSTNESMSTTTITPYES